MFYDCEAQAGSAGFAGPAFVDSVESFKDALLLVFGDADAGVLYREKGVVLLLAGPDQDGAVFAIVLDGILDEVLDEFFEQVPVSREQGGFSIAGQGEVVGPGADGEISAAFFSQGCQIHGCEFSGEFFVVEFRQTDDVVDQREQAVGIMADLFGYMGHLIRGDHIVLEKFRIAGDGCQGGFEFMGHIGSEILTHGGRFQDVFMLGSDLVCKGLQFPVDRFVDRAVQTFCHLVQRPEKLDGQEMSEKDADHQKDQADREHDGE